MALSKSAQAVQASTSNAAAGTTTSSAFAVNYQVDGLSQITNGGTGPTIGCDSVLQGSNDGGTTWFELTRQTAPTTISTTFGFPFTLALGGNFGAWDHYRVQWTGNTGQAVTVQGDAETVTSV